MLRRQRGEGGRTSSDDLDDLPSTSLPSELPKARRAEAPAAGATTPRKTVKFSYDDGGATAERMLFFSADDVVGSASLAEGEAAPGVEPGRVVEIRRAGISSIGLVLAPILMGGRDRLLLLRPSGEIWPVSRTDVQFSMPASLVPSALIAECWAPELLTLWAKGEDIGLAGGADALLGAERTASMLAARRQVGTLLRKVQRETERMEARLTGGSLKSGRGGGIEALWEAFTPADGERQGSVTSAQAAEHLLNADGGERYIAVRVNTLPAYAAHVILMRRPDLFLADDSGMLETGMFLVRSRNARRRIEAGQHVVETDDAVLQQFAEKGVPLVAAAREGRPVENPPQWTEAERDLLHLLTLSLYEIRATQASPVHAIAAGIVKAFGIAPNQRIDSGVVAGLLADLGVLPPTDSLRTSMVAESVERAIDRSGMRADVAPAPSATAPVDALDGRREDVTHRVYVIDDPTALELDDGIALERVGDGTFWVHVHVADPTRFLDMAHPDAVRASFQATSLYLPEGTTPLLPHELGDGSLSLGSGDGQGCMTFSARVDADGNMLDTKASAGWLKSAVVTTYAEVDARLGHEAKPSSYPFGRRDAPPTTRRNDELTAEDLDNLATLRDLAVVLRRRRTASAGLAWGGNAPNISLLNAPLPAANLFDRASIPASPQTFNPARPDDVAFTYALPTANLFTDVSASTTVAELMILANRVAAKFCADRNLPVLFRTTAAPSNTSNTPASHTLAKLLEMREEGSFLSELDIARANLVFRASGVSTTPGPHWVMGFTDNDWGYVRATSPLRRYEDLLVHWQIKAALAGERGLGEAEVTALADRSKRGEQRAKYADRHASAFWTAALLAQRSAGPRPAGYAYGADAVDVAGPLKAVVVGTSGITATQTRTPVRVPALGLALTLNQKGRHRGFALGEEVDVVLDEIELWPAPLITVTLAKP
ncbi:Mitochondrial protein cyt-4 [Vanrija pseudolonga]|uniref:Mitochondrial protein cyt-4 n=1 Tax=Vanrija pseudolonga TaxID=143232 RepID=A0AAF0Y5G8_9TREE|nr:Mitochondrial protein cyt-4 [Vanrija pseudolonga]